MSIKMSATLPKSGNGLESIYGPLTGNPEGLHVVIAVIDAKQLTTDTDSEEVTPTVRIRHIEVVEPGSRESARAMMQCAQEHRTGAIELPFDAAFGSYGDE